VTTAQIEAAPIAANMAYRITMIRTPPLLRRILAAGA
jgi:hypothetical protein